MRKKSISIVIPTYNRRNCIMNAVNSALEQDLSKFDIEIIVSDDGSTDGTEKLFKKHDKRIKYFWHENKGVNAARNMGIKKAKGDYILFLDSDDMLTKDAFKIISKYMDKFNMVNFFGTKEMKTGKKMYHLDGTRKYSYKEWLEKKKISGEFLAMVKRDVFFKDMFDEKRFAFEGFFWNRVIKKYGVFAVDKVCRLYSFEQENRISKDLLKPENALKRFEDYKKYIELFGNDYIKYKLSKQYSKLLYTIGFYAFLSGNCKLGKEYFRKAIKNNKKNIIAYITLILSYLGKKIFVSIFKIINRNIKK